MNINNEVFLQLMAGVLLVQWIIIIGMIIVIVKHSKNIKRLDYVMDDIDEDPLKGWSKKDKA